MVDYIKRLYIWSKQPWPLHLLLLFMVIHVIGLKVFLNNIDNWNLFSSTFLQLFGGWFVIKTINDNLGVLSSSSITEHVRRYLKSMPTYKPKSITIQLQGGSASTSTGFAKLTVSKKLKTTKEKIEFLFSEIKRLETENRESKVELNRRIDNLKSTMDESIRSQKKDIENIRGKLVDTLIGGAKEEALGILCIFYSLLIPYVTLLVNSLFGAAGT